MKSPILLSVFLIVAAGADPKPDTPREISKPVREAINSLLKDPEWGADKTEGGSGLEIQPLVEQGAKAVDDMVSAWNEFRDIEPAADAPKESEPVPPRAQVRRRWLYSIQMMTMEMDFSEPARGHAAALFIHVAASDPNPFVQNVGLAMAAFMPTGHADDLSVFIDTMADPREMSSCGTLGSMATMALYQQVAEECQPAQPDKLPEKELQAVWRKWFEENKANLEFDPKAHKFRVKKQPAEPDPAK